MTTPEDKNNNKDIVQGQVFKETITLETDSTNPIIGSLQADFGLCEADYLRIKNGYPKTLIWAHSILLANAGLGISILGKYIDRILNGSNTPILAWEKYGFISALIVSFFLYLLGIFLPNEKKKVMKDIKNHFEYSPRTKHIVGK